MILFSVFQSMGRVDEGCVLICESVVIYLEVIKWLPTYKSRWRGTFESCTYGYAYCLKWYGNKVVAGAARWFFEGDFIYQTGWKQYPIERSIR